MSVMNMGLQLAHSESVLETPGGAVLTGDVRDFNLEFRNQVTKLVHEILREHYVTQHASSQHEARRWGLTLEQMVAAAVSNRVMKKVDEEYL